MTKTNIHAGCVVVGRKGVLLLGPSGAGKSDLALRLIDGGARLVSDDRTDLFVKDGKLQARAPASIAGLTTIPGGVPEPASLLLLLSACVAICSRRCKSASNSSPRDHCRETTSLSELGKILNNSSV